MKILNIFILMGLLTACKTNSQSKEEFVMNQQSTAYWYDGKAEISSYALEQARYGEIRKGTCVTVFVTEDFLKDKLVKPDNVLSQVGNTTKVLKLNMIKNFNTGIYNYSMMLSVFTPVDLKNQTLKITSSVSEWCGQAFAIMELKDQKYKYRSFSYFEKEVEREFELNKTWSEDEIWNIIKISPEKLPVGNVKMINGFFYVRLNHRKLQIEQVETKLNKHITCPEWYNTKDILNSYEIKYPEINRKLTIFFTENFPHSIIGWEDVYPDLISKDKKIMTTRAVLIKTIKSDYWTKQSNNDAFLRDSLGLEN